MLVPDEVRKCVIFVMYKSSNELKMVGTAFVISIPHEITEDGKFIYIVTAKHVIEWIRNNSSDDKVYLRFNAKDGSNQIASSSIEKWQSHPTDDSVDVSILPKAPPPERYEYISIPVSMAATEKIIKEESIGVGDEVFLTGLFSSHYGRKRNLPIVRVGNIALMPEEKIETGNLGPIDAYLVESRSIGGLSGSPVFVHLGAVRTIKGKTQLGRKTMFYWLGLMHGHWDAPIHELDEVKEDSTKERVNMGIAIVIPATKILEIINSTEFSEMRKNIEKDIRKKGLSTPKAGKPQ